MGKRSDLSIPQRREVVLMLLRLDELMHVSWGIPGTIQPVWKDGQLPVLEEHPIAAVVRGCAVGDGARGANRMGLQSAVPSTASRP